MKKLMIYPVTQNNTYFIRYKDLLKDYKLVSASVDDSVEKQGFDCSVLDWIRPDAFQIINYKEALEKCDSLFIDNHEGIKTEKYLDKINEALIYKKEVIISRDLFKRMKKEKIEKDKMVCIIESEENNYDKNMVSKIISDGLMDIEIPVILTVGLGENCRKFDTQLGVRQHFIKKGYNILQFGTKSTCKLFGFEELPNFLYESLYTFEEKIHLFNQFIAQKVNEGIYDAVIIGVPGGIIPYNKYFTNHFGEMALIITNAVKADITILNVYYFEGMNQEYLDSLREHCMHRLNIKIDYIATVNISNIVLMEGDYPEVNYILSSNYTVDNYIKSNNFKDLPLIFPLYTSEEVNAYETIYEELTNNLDVI